MKALHALTLSVAMLAAGICHAGDGAYPDQQQRRQREPADWRGQLDPSWPESLRDFDHMPMIE